MTYYEASKQLKDLSEQYRNECFAKCGMNTATTKELRLKVVSLTEYLKNEDAKVPTGHGHCMRGNYPSCFGEKYNSFIRFVNKIKGIRNFIFNA